MSGFPVDLRSDTVTRPTPAMRRAMAEAEVADDLLDGDPTTRRLEARVADLLGKERALFFPSGVMANQAALAVLAEPGTEIVVEAGAHVFHYEEGAAARLSGLQLRPVPTADGLLTAEAVRSAIRPDSPYVLRTSAVALENTHLASGGRIHPLAEQRQIRAVAEDRGLPVHLDGARLWHAAAATGVEPAELAEPADTVMVSLSKGLGAPVGSVLAGPASVIGEAWRIRRRFGGGMRQSGVLAAAGLHALERHRGRLEEDHGNARRLARGVAGIPGLDAAEPETNIVFVDMEEGGPDPERIVGFLEESGVRLIHFGPGRLRAVTHRDVDEAGIDRAVAALADAARALSP